MSGAKPTLIGIDVGTTSVKVVAVDEMGRVLAEEEVEQPVSVPRPGWSEQHPETWWRSTRDAVSTIMSALGSLPATVDVRAIGLSGQMHSSVFLDHAGEVIRPALLWNDVRTTRQCHQMTDALGLDGLRRTVGNLALEGFTAPKLLWLRENEPDAYDRLRTLLLPKDYIRYRLTGELATEPSDAAGTMLFDVRRRCWSDEVLSSLGISSDLLPGIVGSTDVSGIVTPSVARELGLPGSTPVIGGGADNAAGAVGSGVVVPGRVQSSIGTSGALATPVGRPRVDDEMRLHTFCHSVPDLWYLMGVVLSAGNALRWLRDILSEGGDVSYDLLTKEATDVDPGSDGLLFLPYLTGERTPHNDPNARGVFFGLHLGHTRGHLARAVMEGVTFALRDSLELMRAMVEEIPEVRAIGGGARSSLWRQLQADVFGTPVLSLGDTGGPAYGAAIMAAVGVGIFDSIEETVDNWVAVAETTAPDAQRVPLYDELYERYRALYPILKERFAHTARPVGAGRV